MEIKKTVGQAGQYRKNYVIHTKCGKEYFAKAAVSQGYECGGVKFKSLREVKSAIVAGDFAEEATEASEVSMSDGVDTWDCVHPCALLCAREFAFGNMKDVYLETLGNYGWLDVMGRPDIARAEREIKRVDNLRKGE